MEESIKMARTRALAGVIRERHLGAATERRQIAAAVSQLQGLRFGFVLHVALLVCVLALSFVSGMVFANIKRTTSELEIALEIHAQADALLKQLESIQRELATPPTQQNRMTPNAGQVSSL